jgi:ATP-dependent DNA helicase DinG
MLMESPYYRTKPEAGRFTPEVIILEAKLNSPPFPGFAARLDQVAQVFSPDGVLSRAADQFMPRSGQTQMALAVAAVIETGGALVVEAGTGVGKTFSYLVPALLSGERVLISTATKTLQDQLFGRDLPGLARALGLPTRMAMLKGRASYLCLHRMERVRQGGGLSERAALTTLAQIEQWSQFTRSGDLAELPGLDERSSLIPLVTSTRDNCLGAQCPRVRDCHVNLARREAMAADVVVINHHLFFADLAVRESGMAELLPSVRVVVFDEAHQLNETGVQFLGAQVSTGQLVDFARDLLACGLLLARGLVDWHTLAATMERAARDLRLTVGKGSAPRLPWQQGAPEGLSEMVWQAALHDLRTACLRAMEGLEQVCELAPDFERLHARAQAFSQRLSQFAGPGDADTVRWLDVGAQLKLVESPLDIAQAVQTRLLGAAPEAGAAPAKAWIFTSATLGTDDALSWFTEPCGLTAARTLRVDSPFDYANQACLYVPEHLPPPSDPAHSVQVAALAADAVSLLRGRTMVLTTSLRALRTIGEALQTHFGFASEVQVLVQGELPKRELMARFRQGGQAGQPGCVLVASASFWEGVDVAGAALQLLIIDKLPFPAPNDPLVQARSQRLQATGRSPFKDYHLPEAAVALKQGAGRLIRRESDRGVLVVCDTRLSAKGYGKKLLAALPPMRRLNTPEEFHQALHDLTTVSTTDPAVA